MIDDAMFEIGGWYRSQKGLFEIVAMDMDEQEPCIEIQYYDGAIEELELESWRLMSIERAAPPEDWIGPFDDIERSELDEGDIIIYSESEGSLTYY